MTVTIDIDVNARSAFVKLEALDRMMEKLDDKMGSMNTDLDLNIGDEIQGMVDELEDVKRELSNMDIRASSGGSGGGGGGGGDDDDGIIGSRRKGMPSPRRMAGNIERRFGMPRDSIDPDILDGMNIKEVRAQIGQFNHDVMGRDPQNRGLAVANTPRMGMIGKDGFFPDRGPDRNLFNEMDEGFGFWNLLKGESNQLRDGDLDLRNALTPKLMKPGRGKGLGRGLSGGMGEALESINRGWGKMGRHLRRLKPNMRKIWNLIALLIPIAIGFGTQLLGVAAALGAVAAAGASVMALGLFGHGDTMAESMRNAKKELGDLKKAMFETFQPTMQLFAPIQSQFFDYMPGQMTKIAESMEGLTAYEGTFYTLFDGAVAGIAEFFNIITRTEGEVSQLANRFGTIAGSAILDFFEWLIVTAYENQQMLIELGMAIYHVLGAIYDISMVVSKLVAAFLPLFELLAIVADLLNSRFMLGILGAVAGIMLLSYTITKVLGVAYSFWLALMTIKAALILLGGGGILAGISAFFSVLLSYIVATTIALWEMSAALTAVAATLALTGLGAILVGAGALVSGMVTSGTSKPPSQMPGGGSRNGGRFPGETNVEINNYGEMQNADQQAIRDEIKRSQGESRGMSTPGTEPDSSLGKGRSPGGS